MTNLTSSTRALLHRAGWREHTQVDTTEYERVLSEAGYHVHLASRKFLSQYGGLHVVHPHFSNPKENDEVHFNPLEAVRRTFVENISQDGEPLGTTLCVIGECCYGKLTLTMSPDGRVFASNDFYLGYVGESGDDAIEAMCSGRRFTEIPYKSADNA